MSPVDPKERILALPRTPPRVTWEGDMAVAVPDTPEANAGFEIAAVDLSMPPGELQERL